MKLIGKRKLIKFARKNRGNVILQKSIRLFQKEVSDSVWTSQQDLGSSAITFDSVHSGGFYIADISIHRAMVAITFINTNELKCCDKLKSSKDESETIEGKKNEFGEVNVLWVGTHDEYELIFGNNKSVIEKWLRSHGHIS